MSPADRPDLRTGGGADPACLALRAHIAEAGFVSSAGSANYETEPAGGCPPGRDRSSTDAGVVLGELTLAPHEKEHVGSCASCRFDLAHAAPAALFALLALERKPAAFWTGFETRVLAEIRESERHPRGWAALFLRPRTLALAAGVSMIAILAVLGRLGAPAELPLVAHARNQMPSEDATKIALVPPGEESPIGETILPVTSKRGEGSYLPLERNAAPPAPVEAVSSPSARVYTISVADSLKDNNEGSDVVVIVDTGIDI